MLFAAVLALAGLSPPNPAFAIVYALTLLVMLGIPRVAYRRVLNRTAGRLREDAVRSVLLVGSGEDVDLFLRAMTHERRQGFRVEGLLAIGSRQTGRRIQGQPFLGSHTEAGTVLERLAAEGRLPDTLVITTPDLSGTDLAGLVTQAERFGLTVRRAPRPTALGPAGATTSGTQLELRPVAIEDLLNRPQVPLDRDGMARLIQGRRVIVTGAGGTIGSELARQVAAFGPETLILLDNGEYALWQIDLELAETHPQVRRHALIADIRDEARVRAVFEFAAARTGVPRRRAEARADRRGQPAGRAAHQRRRHPPCRRRGPRGGRAGDGADLHRQGGEPDLGDGRVEAAGGNVLPGAGYHRRAIPARACAASPCGSATCWAAPAPWCRCSSASLRAAAR